MIGFGKIEARPCDQKMLFEEADPSRYCGRMSRLSLCPPHHPFHCFVNVGGFFIPVLNYKK
jgi:hypothetical protein